MAHCASVTLKKISRCMVCIYLILCFMLTYITDLFNVKVKVISRSKCKNEAIVSNFTLLKVILQVSIALTAKIINIVLNIGQFYSFIDKVFFMFSWFYTYFE